MSASAVTVGALTAWLPWLRSGRRDYDAFALARAARDLDVADAAWERLLVVGVFALPALAGGAWLAVAVRRAGVARLVAGAGGAVLISAAAVALAADLPARAGPIAGVAVGTLTILAVGHRSRHWSKRPRTSPANRRPSD